MLPTESQLRVGTRRVIAQAVSCALGQFTTIGKTIAIHSALCTIVVEAVAINSTRSCRGCTTNILLRRYATNTVGASEISVAIIISWATRSTLGNWSNSTNTIDASESTRAILVSRVAFSALGNERNSAFSIDAFVSTDARIDFITATFTRPEECRLAFTLNARISIDADFATCAAILTRFNGNLVGFATISMDT